MNEQCIGCMYCDTLDGSLRTADCTYPELLQVKDGICLSRREGKKKEVTYG